MPNKVKPLSVGVLRSLCCSVLLRFWDANLKCNMHKKSPSRLTEAKTAPERQSTQHQLTQRSLYAKPFFMWIVFNVHSLGFTQTMVAGGVGFTFTSQITAASVFGSFV